MASHTLKLAAGSLLAAVLIVLVSWLAFFDQINSLAYDFTLRLSGSLPVTSDVIIVAVDEESLDRIGRWPWPRSIQADLLRGVSRGNPSVIGIDFVMDDPTSPQEDAAMEAAIRDAGNVVLGARVDESGPDLIWRLPLEAFRRAGRGMGHVHADPDLDSVLRQYVTAKHVDGRVVSALAVEVLKVAGRLPDGIEQDLGGAARIVAEPRRIRFAGDRGTFPQVGAWEVLQPNFDANRFAGRQVLVGVTAEGMDDWMTPVSAAGRRMSGIEVHANVLESLYAGRTVRDVPLWILVTGLALLIAGLYRMERRFEDFRFYVVSVMAFPLLVGASWFLMRWDLWLPFPTFYAAVGLIAPALGIRKLVRVNRDLDHKISRLSVWAAEPETPKSRLSELRHELEAGVEDEGLRRRWLDLLDSYEAERAGREERRERLLVRRRHNAPWKLDAVDFFNEQLYRFVTFNESVLAGIEDVIIVSDPAGQVVYQNAAARKLANFSEQPPSLWIYLSALLDTQPLLETFGRVLSSGDTARFERIPSRDSNRFYSLNLSPVSQIGVVVTFHDVTAEQQLDQAKNDMVSLVSHELRTPLTSIRGYGDMLARYGLVEEKGQEFLQSILSESARLNDMIQSFLDVASIESGRKKLDRSTFRIEPLLDEVLGGLRPVAQYKKIALENAIRGDAGRVRADRALLHQVLTNLISNAIKYSPPGTVVRVEVDRTESVVCFRVVDQGHGIPQEDATRIFEKFYRRSNPETREETGFGLGLSFVREVAEQHGGGVGVESKVGEGSVFSFWIPIE